MSIRIDELIARREDLLIELDELSMGIASAAQQIEFNPVAFNAIDQLMEGRLAPALAEIGLPPKNSSRLCESDGLDQDPEIARAINHPLLG